MLSTIDELEDGSIPEDAEPEMVAEAIDYALQVIDNTKRVVTCLENARQSGNASGQLQALRLSQIHRAAVLKQYGEESPVSVISTENAGNASWVVMALEEEAAASKNILTRMLDAVIKAFNWLWEKISSLFSSGETKKDAVAKGEAVLSKLESQIKITPNFPQGAELTGGEIRSYLGHLGADVAISALEEIAVHQTQQTSELNGVIAAVSKRLRDAASIGDRIKNSPTAETVGKEKTEFENNVLSDIKTFVKTPYEANKHSGYNAVKEGSDIVPDKAVVLGPVLTASGPVITVIAAVTKGGYKGFVGAKKEKAADKVKVSLPTALSGLLQFQEKVNKLHEAMGGMNDDLKSKMSSLVSDGKAVVASLNSMKSMVDKADDKAVSEAIKSYSAIAQSVGGLQANFLSTTNNFKKSSEFLGKIVPMAIDIADGKKGGKKDKAAGDKPEEQKPA